MSTKDDKPSVAPNTKPLTDREPPAFVKSREAATRNMSMRDAEIRSQLAMSYADPLHIPPEIVPDGVDYHWGRDTYRNEPDPARLMVLEQRGWTVVPSDRHPQFSRKRQDERDRHLDGYVHYKGLILMERPKRWGEIEHEMEAEACYESMVGLPGMNTMHSEDYSRMGVRTKAFANQTSTSKTARAAFKD